MATRKDLTDQSKEGCEEEAGCLIGGTGSTFDWKTRKQQKYEKLAHNE